MRVFDDKALKLQRQGRMGTYAPMKGQEACQVGSVILLKKDDLIFPAFRENGVFMMRGVPAEKIYWYWMGDERGMKIPKETGMFPVSITVGAHPLHAVGAAMASKILKKKSVAITYFGDGATSEGDCLEAFNFAGALNAPVVFICQNNQWAISLPVEQQTASKTLAQKAIAFGFEGIQVDGNDPFAVYVATEYALKKARSGKGPTLIECFTYRLADHTTSDDAKKYRKVSEVKKWEKKDPIIRLEKYMKSQKLLSESYKKDIWDKAMKKIDAAVIKAEGFERYDPEEIFNYIYKEKTPDLIEQQAFAKKEWASDVSLQKTKITSAGKIKKVNEKGTGVVGELEEAK